MTSQQSSSTDRAGQQVSSGATQFPGNNPVWTNKNLWTHALKHRQVTLKLPHMHRYNFLQTIRGSQWKANIPNFYRLQHGESLESVLQ